MNKTFGYVRMYTRNILNFLGNILFAILIIFVIIVYETKRLITNLFKK